MKIYVITQGEYDYYHICYVTEDKAKAEALVDRYNELYPNGDPVSITPCDTDDMPTVTPDSFFFFVCRDHNWANGTLVKESTYTAFEDDQLSHYFTTVAKTSEEAIDIFRKRKQRVKEEKE